MKQKVTDVNQLLRESDSLVVHQEQIHDVCVVTQTLFISIMKNSSTHVNVSTGHLRTLVHILQLQHSVLATIREVPQRCITGLVATIVMIPLPTLVMALHGRVEAESAIVAPVDKAQEMDGWSIISTVAVAIINRLAKVGVVPTTFQLVVGNG